MLANDDGHLSAFFFLFESTAAMMNYARVFARIILFDNVVLDGESILRIFHCDSNH